MNESKQTLQLLARQWMITDAFEHEEHDAGEGVIGQQSTLRPGEAFSYNSSCPLKTPSGTMEGRYQMRGADTKLFDAKIGRFFFKHFQSKSRLNDRLKAF